MSAQSGDLPVTGYSQPARDVVVVPLKYFKRNKVSTGAGLSVMIVYSKQKKALTCPKQIHGQLPWRG